MKLDQKGKLIIFIGIIFIFLIFLILQSTNLTKNDSLFPLTKSNPSPTPMPFAQITIPYLRARTYSSSLGSMEQATNGTNYTGYLTSYTSDGLKINGLLTKPDGQMPKNGWPAIVFIHGYISPTQYQTLERYIAYVDYLARNGFVVFKIDLRGHGDSEGQAGGGYFGSDYVVDTLNAYTALQSSGFVNSKEIGLWGHSMAGNVVMRSFAVKPDIPAVVIWAGAVYSYVDQQKYGIHDNSYHTPQIVTRQQNSRRDLFDKVGSPSAHTAFWQQMAPTNYLQDLKGAIEIHHAQDDEVVNIGYSRDLIALLDKTSVPHQYFEYPTGGHNIVDPSFSLAMQRTVEFFKKYLKGE